MIEKVESQEKTIKKKHGWFKKLSGIVLLSLMSVILLVLGLFAGLYSEWFQDALRERLVETINKNPDTHFELGHFHLRFPLDLTVSDLLMVNHGDTIIEAGRVTANVNIKPILKGEIELTEASLSKARYQLGSLDSASRMIISGREINVGKSVVKLSPMDIDVSTIALDSAKVNMWINPADTFPVTPPSKTELGIKVGRVDYNNLTFEMQLMPTIYSLNANIGNGSIDSVNVDVFNQTVEIADFNGERLDATYLMPDAEQIARTEVIVNNDKPVSEPWTIRLRHISMTDSKALYTTFGLKPLPGLDFEYIAVDDIDLNVTDFYNKASEISLPFSVTGVERCGIDLSAAGTLKIDSVGMSFNRFSLTTPTGTFLKADGYMGTETALTEPATPLRLDLQGKISVGDIKTMFPAFGPYLAGMRKGAEIMANVDIGGTSGDLRIATLDLKVDKHISLAASGNFRNAFYPEKLSGNVNFDVSVTDVSTWTKKLLAGTGIVIPALTIKGKANFDKTDYIADFVGRTHNGTIALDGAFYGKAEKYNLDMTASEFPVNAFLPEMGIGRVTAKVNATGQGFDFFKKTTFADAEINIGRVEYRDRQFSDIDLSAKVGNDVADIVLDSTNPGLDLHLTAHGEIKDGKYNWLIDLNSEDLNLADLGLSETDAVVSADLTLRASISRSLKEIDATLDLNSASYNTPESTLSIDKSKVILSTNDSMTNVIAQNRDLYAYYSSPLPLDSIMGRVTRVTQEIDAQYKRHSIDIEALQNAIMPFSLDVDGGNDNILSEMLGESDIHFKHVSMLAGNDSTLYLKARLLDLETASLNLDTIAIDIRQVGNKIEYSASVNNRPGTFDQWAHVNLDGYFTDGRLGLNLLQKDIRNKIGFNFGAALSLNNDSTMTLHLEPYEPIINYQKWSVNHDNFITYNFSHKHLDANLMMKSAYSRIALYTEHVSESDMAMHGADEDLILQLFDIRLQDWIALDPFAPPIKGNVSAGLRLNWEDNVLNGSGTVELTDFYYGKEKVGDFDVNLDVKTDAVGHVNADAEIWINGVKSMALSGVLNDDNQDSPFNLDFKMIHIPLSVVNPFLIGTATLNGSMNGEFDIKGSSSQPILNGFLSFNDANINVKMLGSQFTLNQDTIPVHDNLVTFKDFKIKAANDNPLFINGDVDLSKISSPQISLALTANNMQIVNTDRPRSGAEVYGKAFVGINATAKGNLNVLNVNGNINLLPGTNVTYVLAGGASSLETQSAGSMVKFVNFADTAAVAAADSLKIEGMIVNINANLNIQTGTIINVDLGTNAQDRVQIQGTGNFNYVSSPVGDGRLTGRYTFSGGFIKYSPPLISNLNFGFTEGSYVAFNGNLLNPQLNVKAVERMRANVSQAGQNSRLIYFDIILSVTGSLENMNVAFNLETDDDVTVANELASMSPTQRASEAMNLLLYNTYTGGSTKATSNLNGNPLFSFLTNSVNSWLANNVRGVDLSIGVDQYDQTTNGMSQTTTAYSYRVSKTLFNDRVKIIVGGSYSDDPNENGNVAENLINDISVEYFLNNARTMYLRLFRHTGYESILEGEITQTGVGFVYRKRIGKIRDMFIPSRFRRKDKNDDKTKENENKDQNINDTPLNDKE